MSKLRLLFNSIAAHATMSPYKSPFDIKSASIDALALHLYTLDLARLEQAFSVRLAKRAGQLLHEPTLLDLATLEVNTSVDELLALRELTARFGLQAISIRHPDPSLADIAAAAGFGAALALVMSSYLGVHSIFSIPVGAFLFSMLAASLLFGLALMRNVSSQTIILAGIALLFLFQSLLSLLQFVSSAELNQQIVFWLFGSLMRTTWQTLTITTVVTLVCAVLLYRDAWKLTCLRLGEARARSLGVNINRLRIKTLVLVALMTATAISFVGIIGFVGLVAPHIGRMLIGEDQRFLIPLSALCGAAILSVSSVISKSIVPGALFPIGIVTAIIGVPFFIWLILGRGRQHA